MIETPTLYKMIYYSHINEDNRVERKLLQEMPCQTVVLVCGSGERVLALMDNINSTRFIIVDSNEEAIQLLQLKLEVLKQFPLIDYLQFIGHSSTTKKQRLKIFDEIKGKLPPGTRAYWEANKKIIEKGVLYCGHFERFLGRTRFITNLYLGKNFQTIFNERYEGKRFPHLRWNLLRKIFSHKLAYQLAGNRDIAFVGPNTKMHLIPNSLNETIGNNEAYSSFMAHLIFKGNLSHMPEKYLPPSLQEQVLSAVKQRLLAGQVQMEYHVSDLLAFVSSRNDLDTKRVFYSISDILSFVDFSYVKRLVTHISKNNGVVVGRGFLRNRLTKEQCSELNACGKLALHDEEESTRMYQVFSVKTAIA